jgi:hypothetical protein
MVVSGKFQRKRESLCLVFLIYGKSHGMVSQVDPGKGKYRQLGQDGKTQGYGESTPGK